MVRFIIELDGMPDKIGKEFTFQYGQIYYLQKKLTNSSKPYHLHSNMVRFIIWSIRPGVPNFERFTFQYGQIYYTRGLNNFATVS